MKTYISWIIDYNYFLRLNGSYEALRGGCASEAMEDFTGGVSENYDVRKGLPPKFGQVLLKAHERCSLMSCTIDVSLDT